MDAEDPHVQLTAVATIMTAVAAIIGAFVAAGLIQGPGSQATPDGSAGRVQVTASAVASTILTSAWVKHAEVICEEADRALEYLETTGQVAQWWQAARAKAVVLRIMSTALRRLAVPPSAIPSVRLMTSDWYSAAAAYDAVAVAYRTGNLDAVLDQVNREMTLMDAGDQTAAALGLDRCARIRGDLIRVRWP